MKPQPQFLLLKGGMKMRLVSFVLVAFLVGLTLPAHSQTQDVYRVEIEPEEEGTKDSLITVRGQTLSLEQARGLASGFKREEYPPLLFWHIWGETEDSTFVCEVLPDSSEFRSLYKTARQALGEKVEGDITIGVFTDRREGGHVPGRYVYCYWDMKSPELLGEKTYFIASYTGLTAGRRIRLTSVDTDIASLVPPFLEMALKEAIGGSKIDLPSAPPIRGRKVFY